MQMPQLFGSDYVLPVIIVVVLLIAILGLILLRRRQQGGGAGGRAAKADEAAMKAEKPSRESRKAVALAARAERETADAAAVAAAAGVPTEAPVGTPGPETPPPVPAPGAATGDLFAADSPVPAAQPAAAATAAGAAVAGAAAAQTPTAGPVFPPPPTPSAPVPPPAKQKGGKPSLDSAAAAALAADPLQAVLSSILGGWGDLSAEDTNRLDVFRRDRVVAAIMAIEPPKETRSNEYARTRLTQLRRYAAHLEMGEPTPAPEREMQEFAGIGYGGQTGAAAAVAGVTAAAGLTPPPAGLGTGAAAGPAGAGPAESTPGPAGTEAVPVPVAGTVQQSPRAQTKSWYSVEPAEPEAVKTPAEPRDWNASPTGEYEDEETAGHERAAEFDWGSSPEERIRIPDNPPVDLAWNGEPTPPPAPTVADSLQSALPETAPIQPPTPEPTPVPAAPPVAPFAPPAPPQAAPVEPTPTEPPSTLPSVPPPPDKSGALVADRAAEPRWPVGAPAEPPASAPATAPTGGPTGDEASRNAEAAVAAAAAAFWGTPDAPRMEQVASMMGRKVSTAADILELPEVEQVDMLAFLDPHELVNLLQMTDDKNLKKGVIDTLEHVGNTDSLNGIQASLDDPDPEIQLYALNAAERLLGNEK